MAFITHLTCTSLDPLALPLSHIPSSQRALLGLQMSLVASWLLQQLWGFHHIEQQHGRNSEAWGASVCCGAQWEVYGYQIYVLLWSLSGKWHHFDHIQEEHWKQPQACTAQTLWSLWDIKKVCTQQHAWDNNPVQGTNDHGMTAMTDFQFRQGELRSGQPCTVHMVVIFCGLGQPK